MTTSDTSDAEVPTTVWDVNRRLRYNEALTPDDRRWVDTAAARGDFEFDPLFRLLGVKRNDWSFHGAPNQAFVLFSGHIGCGKSTELRRVHQRLDRPELFLAILLDTSESLDQQNLQYQDVLLALAEALLARLAADDVDVDKVHLRNLEKWFEERIEKHEATREFAAEIKAGAKAEAGIPFLSKIFAQVTTALKTNSTYKDEVRRVVRNHFAEFAAAFNQLIAAAEDACQRRNLGQRILFLVDGTDRLRGDQAESFFVKDVYQLQLIESLFLYTAPIYLVYGGSELHQRFTEIFDLPMVKVCNQDGSSNELGLRTMKEILLARAPVGFFDDETTANYLVDYCGGHPRDLLRLLQYTFQFSRGDQFEFRAAKRAVVELASDYRQFLEEEDYRLLRRIDEQPEAEHGSDRARRLLYNLALLQYNNFWWRSHPVVRTLPGYERAGEA